MARGMVLETLSLKCSAEARTGAPGYCIDLGLQDFAALSNGERVERMPPASPAAWLTRLVPRSGPANRRHRELTCTRASSTLVVTFTINSRTRIVREFDCIAVGNVNARRNSLRPPGEVLFSRCSWSSSDTCSAIKPWPHGVGTRSE